MQQTTQNNEPIKDTSPDSMKELLANKKYQQVVQAIPQVGDLVSGKIVKIGRNKIFIDLNGLAFGVVRGPELNDESGEYSNLKVGDMISTLVIKAENENDETELSFRHISHLKAWGDLTSDLKKGTIVSVTVVDANKGGLLAKFKRIDGFIPVSQLSTQHYPRVEGGDKEKILIKLKALIGKTLKVKIISLNEEEKKVIFSEKATIADKNKNLLSHYHVGSIIEGTISGLTNFGAFIKFDDNLEGLIHISELAWRRIDHPKDIVNINNKIKAKIIGLDENKISLSIKQLTENPWKNVSDKYKVGQTVKGKIIKVSPFGLFVELDTYIHGLAHISELPVDFIKSVNVNNTYDFKIISLEPKEYRLGLKLTKGK
ncbi:MAG: S1 RNA-binding domain-containing protein [Candidatus Aenigmarchaeota archaeon]|nr:S1 RNA-binding domain-containing protein [Candidatus Aenigmarchaeota archaeon]